MGLPKAHSLQRVVGFFEGLNFMNDQYPQNSRNLRTSKKTNYTVIVITALGLTSSSSPSPSQEDWDTWGPLQHEATPRLEGKWQVTVKVDPCDCINRAKNINTNNKIPVHIKYPDYMQ